MVKKYEAIFLFKSDEIEFKSAFEDVKNRLNEFKGHIINEKSLGDRMLEYPIKKQDRGIYELIDFELDVDNLKEFESSMKFIKNLLRYMIMIKRVRKVKIKKPKSRKFKDAKEKEVYGEYRDRDVKDLSSYKEIREKNEFKEIN